MEAEVLFTLAFFLSKYKNINLILQFLTLYSPVISQFMEALYPSPQFHIA